MCIRHGVFPDMRTVCTKPRNNRQKAGGCRRGVQRVSESVGQRGLGEVDIEAFPFALEVSQVRKFGPGAPGEVDIEAFASALEVSQVRKFGPGAPSHHPRSPNARGRGHPQMNNHPPEIAATRPRPSSAHALQVAVHHLLGERACRRRALQILQRADRLCLIRRALDQCVERRLLHLRIGVVHHLPGSLK